MANIVLVENIEWNLKKFGKLWKFLENFMKIDQVCHKILPDFGWFFFLILYKFGRNSRLGIFYEKLAEFSKIIL